MHHKHILTICLIISAVLFVIISIGMVTPYSKIAVICGMLLVFLMTCGFFYATLHLSKFNIALSTPETAKNEASNKPETPSDKATDKNSAKADDKSNADATETPKSEINPSSEVQETAKDDDQDARA